MPPRHECLKCRENWIGWHSRTICPECGGELKTMYVAGGIYTIGDKREFRLVRPSGKGSLPYVSNEPYLESTKYHAHLYKVAGENILERVRMGGAWQVGAPDTAVLTDELTNDLKNAIYSYERVQL